jgi:transposase
MRHSKLDASKQNKLVELFLEGFSARSAAEEAEVNKTTAYQYFHNLRKIISDNLVGDQAFKLEMGRLKNILNKMDQAESILPVFAVKKNTNTISTFLINDIQIENWLFWLSIREKVQAVFYIDSNSSHNVYDISKFKCFCINQQNLSNSFQACDAKIEKFWQFSKNHLSQFNGVPIKNFHLYLQECEWRFNTFDNKIQCNQLLSCV